ncbi:MAG: CoA pyrophosphatase [Chloroflexi bacterium]|nr:CoA pyrophosphatase [Chloroflexota bacterium]
MLNLYDLQAALQRDLPGVAAQSKMGIDSRTRREPPLRSDKPRDSAVIVLIYVENEQLWLPLTLRTNRVANHKGQISLPGGQREQGDANLWETALREAQEEIGIQRERVTYVGKLSSHYIASSHFIVNPYVGWADHLGCFIPSDEVAEIIRLPLSTLLDPFAKGVAVRELDGRSVQVPCYRYQEHIIWGATAMILSELEAVLANIIPA